MNNEGGVDGRFGVFCSVKNEKRFLCKDFTVGANLFVNALFISVQALQ